MKKVTILSALLVQLFVFAFPAAGAEASDQPTRHENWYSQLRHPDTDSVYSLLVAKSRADDRATLNLILIPPQCAPGLPFILIQDESFKKLSPRSGRASIRVDEGSVYKADVTFETDVNIAMISIKKIYGDGWINDFLRGKTARFQLQMQDDEPFYKSFPLAGFTAALKNATSLCKSALPKADEDYFAPSQPRQPQKKPNVPKSDADYFI